MIYNHNLTLGFCPAPPLKPPEFTLSQDQKFFDMYSIVIIVVLLVAFLAYLIKIYDLTQEVYVRDTTEIQAAVAERIRPVGQVNRSSEEQESSAPIIKITPEPIATAMTGLEVYNTACIACHSVGVGGAPITGDVTAWTERIARDAAMLKNNAVQGYIGSVGYMPPKGGRPDISDAEVEAAVNYMIGEVEL